MIPVLIILAGIPTTTHFSGIDVTTTALAPTTTSFSISTGPIIFVPDERIQLSPITGTPFFLVVPPIVTPVPIIYVISNNSVMVNNSTQPSIT